MNEMYNGNRKHTISDSDRLAIQLANMDSRFSNSAGNGLILVVAPILAVFGFFKSLKLACIHSVAGGGKVIYYYYYYY